MTQDNFRPDPRRRSFTQSSQWEDPVLTIYRDIVGYCSKHARASFHFYILFAPNSVRVYAKRIENRSVSPGGTGSQVVGQYRDKASSNDLSGGPLYLRDGNQNARGSIIARACIGLKVKKEKKGKRKGKNVFLALECSRR